jgi:hypothetical protein
LQHSISSRTSDIGQEMGFIGTAQSAARLPGLGGTQEPRGPLVVKEERSRHKAVVSIRAYVPCQNGHTAAAAASAAAAARKPR